MSTLGYCRLFDKTLLKRLLPSPVFLPYFIFLSLASFYFNNHWSRTITATVSECQRIPSEPIENGEKKCNCWQVTTYVATALKEVFNNIIKRRRPFQTWNLSKNLHRRIFRLEILHRQFHLISAVLVGKNTKNE